jgi:NAD-dependent dihydropyrimidine dehydrogenase PreA subunit
MTKIIVDMDKCSGCGTCVDVCPTSVYELKGDKTSVVNPDECIECMACEDQCPEGAIKIETG